MEGKKLLAHELTHVIQQANGVTQGVQRQESFVHHIVVKKKQIELNGG